MPLSKTRLSLIFPTRITEARLIFPVRKRFCGIKIICAVLWITECRRLKLISASESICPLIIKWIPLCSITFIAFCIRKPHGRQVRNILILRYAGQEPAGPAASVTPFTGAAIHRQHGTAWPKRCAAVFPWGFQALPIGVMTFRAFMAFLIL